jgi:hypothetical protein
MTLPKWATERHDDPYDYERSTAEKIEGARREVASGAFSGMYDVNSEFWMIDNKRTEAASYILKVKDFKALDRKATSEGRFPAKLINYHNDEYSVAVLREVDYLALIQENRGMASIIDELTSALDELTQEES